MAPWAVALPRGRVQRIAAAGRSRWFTVVGGRAWLTTDGDARQDGQDHWLDVGEGVRLQAGVAAVVEGVSDASFQLVEDRAGHGLWGAGSLRRLGRRLDDHRRAVQWGVTSADGLS